MPVCSLDFFCLFPPWRFGIRFLLATILIGLAVPSGSALAQGSFVKIPQEQTGDSPEERNHLAYQDIFQRTYNRGFEGEQVMKDDPSSVEGAFYAFQRGLTILMADPETIENTPTGSGSFWFPKSRSSSEAQPAPGRPKPDSRLPQTEGGDTSMSLYAPDFNTIDRIRDIYERMRSAERNGDQERIADLDSEFQQILRDQIEQIARLQEEEPDTELIGLGKVGPDSEILRLNAGDLRRGVEARPGRHVYAVNPEESSPATLDFSGNQTGPLREPSPEVTAYLKAAMDGMNQPMTQQERFHFEMELGAHGFELSSPSDPRKGVPSYNTYQAYPPEVMYGGSSNLSSRKRTK